MFGLPILPTRENPHAMMTWTPPQECAQHHY